MSHPLNGHNEPAEELPPDEPALDFDPELGHSALTSEHELKEHELPGDDPSPHLWDSWAGGEVHYSLDRAQSAWEAAYWAGTE